MKYLVMIIAVTQASHKLVPNLPYSNWYYLKLTSDIKPVHSCQDQEDPSSQILDNLSTKLSVPQTSFLITSLDTLSAGIISTNLSLLTPLPGLHTNLSNLQISSPEFNICGQQYSLALLLHDRSYLVGGEDGYQVSRQFIEH